MSNKNLTYTLEDIMLENHIGTGIIFRNRVFKCMERSQKLLYNVTKKCNLLELSNEQLAIMLELAQLNRELEEIKAKCIIKEKD